ncbi:hypothetical protein L7F22_046061 [Adiantum nelumboides]|nr:hypothetical protein [Adiantum nelumboides]
MEGSSSGNSRLGRPKHDRSQKTITEHFSSSGRKKSVQVLDLNASQEDPEEAPSQPVDKKKREIERHFRQEWTHAHKWAYPILDKDGRVRVKCKWCATYGFNNVFATHGSTTVQKPALKKHQDSEAHKLADQRWRMKANPDTLPIQKHAELMIDAEKQRIISVMQVMYFVALRDMSLESYKHLCDFQSFMRTPNMPVSNEYSAYTNRTSGMQFLKAAKEVYWSQLETELSESPFFSILIDDSTDRTLEQHLIIYVSYLKDRGTGEVACKFASLLPLSDGKAKTKYKALVEFLGKLKLPWSERLVGFASDGASTMRGVNNGVLTKLSKLAPHLVGVHCVAHREALVIAGACDEFPEFQFMDAFANRIHAWVGRSAKRHKLVDDLMKSFSLRPLEVLRIHDVRWLSRGQTMKRLGDLMPALLEQLKKSDKALYEDATNFQVQFLLHLLIDILHELNVLNQKFQKDTVDITEIAIALDVVIELFQKRYLHQPFGYGSKSLRSFLNGSKDGVICYLDENGQAYRHALQMKGLPMKIGNGETVERESGKTLEGCTDLAMKFVQKIIEGLNDRFRDLPLFNAAKLFAPKYYHRELTVRENINRTFLDRICKRFPGFIDVSECEREMEHFTTKVYKEFPSYGFFEAWEQCAGEDGWIESYPSLLKLWQIMLLIPVSTACCERGFSKQNRIKEDERSSLTLSTLDTLMFLSLSAPQSMHVVEWEKIYDTWASMKRRRAQELVSPS